MTVHFNAGPQHMNGTQALEFSRSRHSNDNGEGSDFARSRRQQLVVAALKQKVVSLGGLGSLPDLLNSLGDNVVTDLHVNDLEALYSLLKDVDTKSILHVSFDDTNFLYECGYPANCGAAYIYAHDRTYAEIAHYVQNVFVDPAVLGQHAPVTIEDASGRGAERLGPLDAAVQVPLAVHHRRRRGSSLGDHPGHRRERRQGRGHRSMVRQVLRRQRHHAHRQPVGVALTRPRPPLPRRPAHRGVVVILGQDEENAFLNTPGVGG